MKSKDLAKYIDHSPLRMAATEEDIRRYCAEAVRYSFHSMVVFPYYVKLASEILKNTEVKVDTVAGFPFGNDFTNMKVAQAWACLEAGADEIDMVMNFPAFINGCYEEVKSDIEAVLEVAKDHGALLKVIIEVEQLTDDQIVRASEVVADAGADFVKTSVGLLKTSVPCTVEKVRLMYKTVKGTNTQVKASGGIHDTNLATKIIEAGATRIGTSKGIELVSEPVKT